jgi:hypothetical protein
MDLHFRFGVPDRSGAQFSFPGSAGRKDYCKREMNCH